MISYRRADIFERARGRRVIYFFDDNRKQIKYYNARKDTISDPKKGIDVDFKEMFGDSWRLIDFDDVIVLLYKNAAEANIGKIVYHEKEIIGNMRKVTIDGMLEVFQPEANSHILIDPTEYVINVVHSKIIITKDPI